MDLTKNQLQWMVRLFAQGGRIVIPSEYDRRALRPLRTLEKRRLVKRSEKKSGLSFAVTSYGRKESCN